MNERELRNDWMSKRNEVTGTTNRCKTYMATNGNLLAAARRLMEMKEITIEQYAEMLRRNKELIHEPRARCFRCGRLLPKDEISTDDICLNCLDSQKRHMKKCFWCDLPSKTKRVRVQYIPEEKDKGYDGKIHNICDNCRRQHRWETYYY